MKTTLMGKGCLAACCLVVISLAAVTLLEGQVAVAQRAIRPPGNLPPAAGKSTDGLHLQGNRINNWNHQMTDGGSYLWDINTNASVNSGTNYAFSGAFYLNVNNNGFYASQGVVNAGNDEVEIGPWSPDSRIRVSRRIKVYKDKPLARWLDIYENTTGQDIQLQLMVSVNYNYGVAKTTTSSGAAAWGEKDFGLVNQSQQGMNPQPPSTALILCDKRSKIRPQVQVQSNQTYIRTNITVPANGAVIMCSFASQNTSTDDLQKLLAGFNASKLLRDLPSGVRKLIVNMQTTSGFDDIDLERSEKFDSVLLANGDPINGSVVNKSFTIEAGFGEITMPADQIIGMASVPTDSSKVRFLTKDGQIIGGKLKGEPLQVRLVPGQVLDIPFTDVTYWSYQVSTARPFDIPTTGPFVMLRTGDRLSFDPSALAIKFRTKYGEVDLDPRHVAHVAMDNIGNGVHRVLFLNGGSIAGFLEPAKVSFQLRVNGQKFDIPRELIAEIQFVPELPKPPPLVRMTLNNGDTLFGRLKDEKLVIKNSYGTTEVAPRSLKTLTFSQAKQNKAVVDLWDGSKGLSGDLQQDELTFEIMPGPTLKIPTGQVVTLATPHALPSEDVSKQVDGLIAKLGADNWKDRQKAQEALIRLGNSIVPVLQDRLKDEDAEIRQRVEEVIIRLGGTPKKIGKTPLGSPPSSGEIIIEDGMVAPAVNWNAPMLAK